MHDYITGWLIWPQDTELRQKWRLRDWDHFKLSLKECWKLVSAVIVLRSRDWKKQWVVYFIHVCKQIANNYVDFSILYLWMIQCKILAHSSEFQVAKLKDQLSTEGRKRQQYNSQSACTRDVFACNQSLDPLSLERETWNQSLEPSPLERVIWKQNDFMNSERSYPKRGEIGSNSVVLNNYPTNVTLNQSREPSPLERVSRKQKDSRNSVNSNMSQSPLPHRILSPERYGRYSGCTSTPNTCRSMSPLSYQETL